MHKGGVPHRDDAAEAGKGNGKGKGKKGKTKTPAELGFDLSLGGKLWVRPAILQGGLPVTEGLEVGNMDEKKLAGKGMERPSPGSAHTEILCDRKSILGNPFQLGKKVQLESMRTPVLAAYDEYLQAVLSGTNPVAIEQIAERHGLDPKENCAKDWRDIYDAGHGAVGVQSALAELRALVASELAGRSRGRRFGLRLLCHCAPLPCHTQLLARRLQRGGEAPAKEADEGVAASLQPLQGRWASKAEDSYIATIRGDILLWPSGGQASIQADGLDTFVLRYKSKEVRGSLMRGELIWDDGDTWIPWSAEEQEDKHSREAPARRVYLRAEEEDRPTLGGHTKPRGKDEAVAVPPPPVAPVEARTSRWGRGRGHAPVGVAAGATKPVGASSSTSHREVQGGKGGLSPVGGKPATRSLHRA